MYNEWVTKLRGRLCRSSIGRPRRQRLPLCFLALGIAIPGLLAWAGSAPAGLASPSGPDQAPALVDGRLTQVGQIAGAMVTVEVEGDLAFVGQGTRVITLDVSLPDQPRLLGRGPILPGQVVELALVDGHVVVLLQRSLVMLDRSRPEALRQVAQSEPFPAGHSAVAMAVAGTLAVIGTSDGLLVFDLTNLARPAHRGTLEFSSCVDIALHRDRALCADSNELRVIDLSQLEMPRLLESIPFSNALIHSVAASDAYVYLSLGNALAVVDLAQPPDLRILYQETLPFEAWKLELAGPRLYATQGRWLAALDLSAPDSPKLLGSLREGQDPDSGQYLQIGPGLSARVDGLVLLADARHAVQVVDASDASSPKRIGGFGGLTSVGTVTLIPGHHALIDKGAIEVWDLSDPAAGRLVGRSAEGARRGDGKLDVEGRLVCAPVPGEGIQLFDISELSAPRLVADVVGLGPLPRCLLHGNLALVIVYGGLVAVDITRPEAPRILGKFERSGFQGNALAAVGPHVLVAASPGLVVLDLSDPNAPRWVTELDLPDIATEITIRGSTAYVMQRERGLTVVDIADPTQPRVLATVREPMVWSTSLAVEGRWAVANGLGSLYLLDIGDPTAPRVVHTLRYSGPLHVDLRDGLVAAAEHTSGLALYRIDTGPPTASPSPTIPASPTPRGQSAGHISVYLPLLFRPR